MIYVYKFREGLDAITFLSLTHSHLSVAIMSKAKISAFNITY